MIGIASQVKIGKTLEAQRHLHLAQRAADGKPAVLSRLLQRGGRQATPPSPVY